MSKNLFEQMKEIESAQEVQWDVYEPAEKVEIIEFSGEVSPNLFGIEPQKATEMVSGLKTVFAEREILKDAYIDVIGLEINAENLPTFKELRLKFVKIRTGIEKWHKTNKAFYLAGGRFVDAIKNKEIAETEEIEAKLFEAEKFFENQEREKAKILNDLRISKILPYVENAEQMDFKEFSDEDFDDFVFGKKVKHEQRIEVERLESERIEKDLIEREKEIEAIRLENIELKRIADEKEAQAQAEQKERERLAKIEKQKSDAIAKELQAKKEAELKAENQRIKKEKAEMTFFMNKICK